MIEHANLRLQWQQQGDSWDEKQLLLASQQAISISDMHLAIDIAKTAEARFNVSHRSQYCCALAYANCGSREEVFRILQPLLDTVTQEDDIFVEVVSLYARLEKDRYTRSVNIEERTEALANALDAYKSAYKVSGASFPAINAATLYLLAGAVNDSKALAAKIITSNAADQEEIWQLATLAEAHLLLEEYDGARHYYLKVAQIAGSNFGLLASIKKHLPFISEKQTIPKDILAILDGPAIAVFSGHMFDTAERASPRFPETLRNPVAQAIGDYIDDTKIRIGYVSAACGGDLIFCREMLKRGLEVNIVLPFAAEEFRRTSVALNGVDESMEFWDVLKHANSITVATDESHLNNPCLYTHAANLIEGYAQLRAQQCDGHVNVVAAIDPYTSGEAGGTTERTVTWLEEGLDVHIIDIGKLRGDVRKSILPTSPKKADARHLDREIMTLVEISSSTYDDAVHNVMFERMNSNSQLTQMTCLKGEGINRAFFNVKDAADYAYQAQAIATMIQWDALDLPKDTQLQIAIHTGPVFPRSKSKHKDYFGTHVFYARELAEVTPPGCIYLTEQAAALLLTHGPKDYASDYLGSMRVKDFDRQIYRLHRI